VSIFSACVHGLKKAAHIAGQKLLPSTPATRVGKRYSAPKSTFPQHFSVKNRKNVVQIHQHPL
jgi:hypothetical protein